MFPQFAVPLGEETFDVIEHERFGQCGDDVRDASMRDDALSLLIEFALFLPINEIGWHGNPQK